MLGCVGLEHRRLFSAFSVLGECVFDQAATFWPPPVLRGGCFEHGRPWQALVVLGDAISEHECAVSTPSVL